MALIDNVNRTLQESLSNALQTSDSIDIAVGYFYMSGFEALATQLRDKKVRILVGIDIANQQPKILTTEAVLESDAVITMGCGDACPFYPGKRYEDWVLEDPAGQDLAFVRKVRDDIKVRVEVLLSELLTNLA